MLQNLDRCGSPAGIEVEHLADQFDGLCWHRAIKPLLNCLALHRFDGVNHRPRQLTIQTVDVLVTGLPGERQDFFQLV
mgnify:FL=1